MHKIYPPVPPEIVEEALLAKIPPMKPSWELPDLPIKACKTIEHATPSTSEAVTDR